MLQGPLKLQSGPLVWKSSNGKHWPPLLGVVCCYDCRRRVFGAANEFVIVLTEPSRKVVGGAHICFFSLSKLKTIHKPRHLLWKQMEGEPLFDTGPKPNLLINKFKSTRVTAWLVFSIAAIAEVGLFAWLILDASQTKDALRKFELGSTNTCPSSGSQTAVIIKVLLAGAALIGTGVGLIILSQNPLDVKKVIDF